MKSNFVLILPIIALLSALTLPEPKSRVQGTVSTLFVPVQWPARVIGMGMKHALSPPPAEDPYATEPPKTFDEARKRNAALLVQIGNLTAQLQDLQKLSSQYLQLGADLRKLVQPATVTGGPTDQRQMLTINTAGLTNVHEKSAVVSTLGLVGQIDNVSLERLSARVKLITDPNSRLTGRFARYLPREDGGVDVIWLDLKPPLVQGTTRGMIIRSLEAGPVRAKLQVGDIVALDDPAFPIPALKGLRLGTVTKITLPPTDAGFAEIELQSSVDFGSLREVLVVK